MTVIFSVLQTTKRGEVYSVSITERVTHLIGRVRILALPPEPSFGISFSPSDLLLRLLWGPWSVSQPWAKSESAELLSES